MAFLDNLVGYWKMDDPNPNDPSGLYVPDYFGRYNLETRFVPANLGAGTLTWASESGPSGLGPAGPGSGWGRPGRTILGHGNSAGCGYGQVTGDQYFCKSTDPGMYLTGSFTIALWFVWMNAQPYNPQYFVSQKRDATTQADFETFGDFSVRDFRFRMYTGSTPVVLNTGDPLVESAVFFSYNAANHEMNLTYGSSSVSAFFTASFQPYGETVFFIKKDSSLSGIINWGNLSNAIDNVCIWSRVLTKAEKDFYSTGVDFDFPGSMIYYNSSDTLEVTKVTEHANIQSGSYSLDTIGYLSLSGSVTEDPTLSREFHLDRSGNLRVRSLNERYT